LCGSIVYRNLCVGVFVSCRSVEQTNIVALIILQNMPLRCQPRMSGLEMTEMTAT